MRLTTTQQASIVHAIGTFVEGQQAELRLYGSRVHDHLKGGDIDLLLITKNADFAEGLNLQKHKLLAAIKKEIGDQRIDLTIVHESEMKSDPFLKSILPDSIPLHQWDGCLS